METAEVKYLGRIGWKTKEGKISLYCFHQCVLIILVHLMRDKCIN